MIMTLPCLPKIKKTSYFIGALSGTSMDSISTILMKFSGNKYSIVKTSRYPFNKLILKKLSHIINSTQCSLEELGTLDHQIGCLFAAAINHLLKTANFTYKQVTAIGLHGQTVWHAPDNKYPFSMQIGDPNIVSTRTKIVTIADFRRKDLANQGQGAPLAPLFHNAIFRNNKKTRAIINLGGIANITVLPKDYRAPIFGFDVGPGNCLMDEWVQQKYHRIKVRFDKHGQLAAKGTVLDSLLAACLTDPYIRRPYPKSTGKEYFNLSWLKQKILLCKTIKSYDNNDILATLSMLTAKIIAITIAQLSPIDEIFLCGGGINNLWLLKNIKETVCCPVYSTQRAGMHPEWVEGALFAWLAKQTYGQKPVNLMPITGSITPQVLGGIFLPN